MATETITTICGFDEAWIGPCKQVGNPRCEKHSNKICASCGAAATKNCPEMGQFVCGENLCNDCEHTIFPSGTNGGVGFNAESLPDGMNRHCKKTEQRFQSWYAREPEAQPAPDTSGEWAYHYTKGRGYRVNDGRGCLAEVRDEATAAHVADHRAVGLLVTALKEFLLSAIEFNDTRLSYVTMQVDRDAIKDAQDALAAVGQEERNETRNRH